VTTAKDSEQLSGGRNQKPRVSTVSPKLCVKKLKTMWQPKLARWGGVPQYRKNNELDWRTCACSMIEIVFLFLPMANLA